MLGAWGVTRGRGGVIPKVVLHTWHEPVEGGDVVVRMHGVVGGGGEGDADELLRVRWRRVVERLGGDGVVEEDEVVWMMRWRRCVRVLDVAWVHED